MSEGFTLWFTGRSVAAGAALARRIAENLRAAGYGKVEVLDDEAIAGGLSQEGPQDDARSAAFVAKLLSRNGVAVLVSVASPSEESRERARSSIENFLEVYCRSSEGPVPGESDPFEEPRNPEIALNPSEESPEESSARVMQLLADMGLLPAAGAGGGYTDEEEAAVKQRLEDLGYF